MKALLFDIGGVVIHDRGLKTQVQAAFPEIPPATLWTELNAAMLPACRGELSRKACWLNLAKQLSVSIEPERAARLWGAADFIRGIEINEEVVSLVRDLRARYKVGVVSNTMHEHAVALRGLGIYAEFDQVVLSHEVGLTKDVPDVFWLALRRLQVTPSEAVFIDDYPPYVEVAASIGLRGIVFRDAQSLKNDISSMGFTHAGLAPQTDA